jgi:type IV secretory pathway protease TraF
MVKRIRAIPRDRLGDRVLGDDEYWVEGDLPAASTDSRQFGPVAREGLKAKVLLVYWPKDRRRRIR